MNCILWLQQSRGAPPIPLRSPTPGYRAKSGGVGADPARIGVALCNAAACDLLRGRTNIAAARLALNIAGRTRKYFRPLILLVLALQCLSAGDVRRAFLCGRAALAASDASPQPTLKIFALNNLAMISVRLGLLDEAAHMLRSALRLAPARAAPLRAHLLLQQGKLSARRAEYGPAMTACSAAVRMFAALSEASGACDAMTVLGAVRMAESRPRRAHSLLRRALRRAAGIADAGVRRLMRARILLLLARLAAGAGHERSARNCVRRALWAAGAIGAHVLEASALVFRAERMAPAVAAAGRIHRRLQSLEAGELPAGLRCRIRQLFVGAAAAAGDYKGAYAQAERARRFWRAERDNRLRSEEALLSATTELQKLRRRGAGLQQANIAAAAGNRTLEAMNIHILALERERSQLLDLASHDLKNPLAALVLDVSILQHYGDRIPAAERSARIDKMLAAVRRLRDIVDGVLQSQSLDDFVRDGAPECFEPAALLHEIAAEFAAKAAVKNQNIHCEIEAGIRIRAARRGLRHALENLLSNALKFSPPGKTVLLGLRRCSGAVHMTVQDQGPGIRADERAKLFTRGAQLSARPTGGEHSSGLGLALVSALMRSMGGGVRHEDAPGGGSRFVLEVPAGATDAEETVT